MRFLFLLLFIVASSAHAQIINSITIIGNETIDRGTILNYMPFDAGDFYNTDSKNLITEQLINTGFFKEVFVSDRGSELTIEVIENPIIRSVKLIMDGAKLIKEDKVKDNLNKFGITEGQIYNERSMITFMTEIREVYKMGGYAQAQAEFNVAVTSDNLVNLTITLAENDITLVDRIIINGNAAYTDGELLKLFTIGEADFFLLNYFTKKDNYSEMKLESSIDALTNFYINNGYLDFKVEDVDIQAENEKLVITVNLNEGVQYTIGNVIFSGTEDKARSAFTMQSGEVFKRQEVVQSVQSVTNYYADQGHAFIQVETDTEKKGDSIDLKVNIEKNQKVFINRISVSGNTRTADSVIRREIGLLEGGLYSNTELDESIRRIKRLGFFKNVNMKVSRVKGTEDRINLHFEVQEDETGRYSVGLSHSNRTGIAFNTGVSQTNIFGTGNTLNAKLKVSKATQKVDLFFKNPHFNNNNHSISYGIFYNSIDGSELESADYVIDKKGISLGYGIPLSEISRLSIDNRLSTIDVQCDATFAGEDYEAKQCADDGNSELLTTVTWSENTLNNFYFPTDGHKTRVSLGVALPFMDYGYYKLNTRYDQYYDLQNEVTFKLKASLGIASGLGGKELPFFERYYGGGASSIRGFAFNSIGSKYPDDSIRGGELNILGSAAIIAPVPTMEDSKEMRISAFMDVGGIFDEVSDFDTSELRASVGTAFIWVTPIGPLGLYLATPIKSKEGDDIERFDFSLGVNF